MCNINYDIFKRNQKMAHGYTSYICETKHVSILRLGQNRCFFPYCYCQKIYMYDIPFCLFKRVEVKILEAQVFSLKIIGIQLLIR